MSLLEHQDIESDQSWSTLLNLKEKLKIGWNVALLSLNYKKKHTFISNTALPRLAVVEQYSVVVKRYQVHFYLIPPP